MNRWVNDRHRRALLAHNTYLGYKTHIESFTGAVGHDRPVGDITPTDIEDWAGDITQRLLVGSVRQYLGTVRRFYRWAHRRGIVAVDPTIDLEIPPDPPTEPRRMRRRTVAEILYCADFREKVMLTVLVGTGIRVGELARMRLADYDPTRRTLLVKGKGKRERLVHVSPEAAYALEVWIRRQGITDVMWPSHRRPGRSLTARTVSEMISAAIGETGEGEGSTGHGLRHTYATELADAGVPVHVIQWTLGHANLDTTSRYLSSGIRQQREYAPDIEYDAARPHGLGAEVEGRGDQVTASEGNVRPLAPLMRLDDRGSS